MNCTKCKIDKPENYFFKRKNRKQYWCKSCCKQAVDKWKSKNPKAISEAQKRRRQEVPHLFAQTRRRATLKKYGLSPEDFLFMLKNQTYCCKICKTATPGGFANQWAVDHDHTTNQTRGILCNNCNKGLGHFKDSIFLLEQAAQYLTYYHRPYEVQGA